MKKVAIIGGQRIPFVKSFTHYNRISNQEMLTACLQALTERYQLAGKRVGDVALGALLNRSTEWNFARECVLGTNLDPHTPAYNVQRACGTSLDTTIQLSLRIAAGQIDTGIAGGSDTNSDLPLLLSQQLSWKLTALRAAKSFGERLKILASIRLKELAPVYPAVVEPRTGLSMGQHTERMVKEWGIHREEQDALAWQSHLNATKAWDTGFYDDLVFPYKGVTKDTIVRSDTSAEKLAKLKPAFDFSGQGTLTAGNSTIYTDGAAAMLLASEEYAQQQKWPVMAHFVDAESAAVDYVHGEGLLMAPTYAVARLLKRQHLRLQDFDIYEIHEAFCGQVLCTLKAWEDPVYCKKLGYDAPLGSIDRSKLNTRGGSVAIGHPFCATGARIVAQTAKLLQERGSGRALISICTAGGMGVVAILQR
ncbi:acetyl-CoA C-acetyltransferase [Chitinophaga nivalis]|uniref:Acetyl-CoA C-acetyltransferase n=1 Tax=Chitinophaga nivalis TaxID=2991709 RepID=A0ABT3IGA7_9BACT|nr:acetyl-CoA C-acetyltransferase [Chitinophaga nivalis]MCW3467311.1 acetyl-CoA C-acetyltransferase [Chitinophaga nivalis]MCW3482997.1 acetyl-CoA C-acetyltransferase [Chitinophaga nivalis]